MAKDGKRSSSHEVRGHKKPILAEHRVKVERLVVETPHMTLETLQAGLAAEEIRVCVGALHNYLKGLIPAAQ